MEPTIPTPTIPTEILPENHTRMLTADERVRLESQGCRSRDWDMVRVTDLTDLRLIRDTRFEGHVCIGRLESPCRIEDCSLTDTVVGDDCTIERVPGGIEGATIMPSATIRNVASLRFEPEAACGVGVEVCVLDETGSRPVRIYPGLSAQAAALMARCPRWASESLYPAISDFLESKVQGPLIGEGAEIVDCGELLNVSVGAGASVRGARRLANGTVVNNSGSTRPLAFIGNGVDAENFILEDGRIDSGAIVRNCYIGQGATLEKGFSAHDSLFFANCSLENGEACALFAGPYTVSMHKSTLLIGCQTSFMNAGSATNQSNHMYKLGAVHWGVLERGVKTSSNSYLMLGANIGAFSLLMGSHKTHPDSTQFPFSYLFGDERGATVVVPAVMLRSCGLMRDEKKWPTRDRRLKRRLPLHDRISFEVLSPLTVDRMLEALATIDELLGRPADDDRFVRYRGMKFSRASLERALMLYRIAIYKYLDQRIPEGVFPESDGEEPQKWVDLAGQIITRPLLERIMQTESLPEIEKMLTESFERREEEELLWIARRFGAEWRERAAEIRPGAEEFDRMVEADRTEYLADLSAENAMLAL